MTTTTTTAPAEDTDVHGNTRQSQADAAGKAIRDAARKISEATMDGADRWAFDHMDTARQEFADAVSSAAMIPDADLTGRADATPTTYADLAAEAAGRAYDAACAAMEG